LIILIIIHDTGGVMKKGLIGMILLCSMLMGCASSAKNSHPKLLYSPTPAYPYYALANRIEGDVRVRYNVGVDGKVSKVWILKSEPQHLFDSAVIAAMSQWRYETNKPSQGLTKTIYFKLQAPPG
jgi:protein TonB